MAIRCTVWGENIHEREDETVAQLYPSGIHGTIARSLAADESIVARTVTLQDPEHGCTQELLAQTDVLIWWGHAAHEVVSEKIVERIVRNVWQGMGFIALHSAHFSKPFLRLMGSPCSLSWREAGERERIWVINRTHPIASDVPDSFELENEEMYGEPFAIPEPLETIFISWFQGGEVFRSGVTYQRGAGRVFYFRPGHETYPTYHDKNVQLILRNAVCWAAASRRWNDITDAPNVPADSAPELIVERGPTIHAAGEQGYK